MVDQACYISKTEPGFGGGSSVTYQLCCSKTYAQTLFLGCSIQSFVIGLGWGSEASRLTVELVTDTCKYPHLINDSGQPIDRPSTPDHYTNARKKIAGAQFEQDSNGNNLIPGKIYYEADGDKLISRYHYDEDPGFYGDMPIATEEYDIIGTPVYFKYDDFEFNGIITNWTKNTDQSKPIDSYTVTIESPVFLLNHTSMILSSYGGSIFTKMGNSQVGFARYESGEYQGKIAEQNIPNIINVFGYLEDSTNLTTNLPHFTNTIVPEMIFGKSGRNDEGIPALNILYALNDLLNYQPLTTVLDQKKILRYSPYGRILGKAIKYKNDGRNVIDTTAKINKKHMGIIWPFIYGRSYGPEHRMPYDIDISELNNDGSIPSFYRIASDSMSILEFIDEVAKNIGKQFFIIMNLRIENSIITPVLKLNTISTLEYGREGAVESFINYLNANGTLVQSYSAGMEFNSSQPVRSMYIGGKQQRLYQVRNKKYSSKQSSLRYNSYLNTFSEINHTEAFAQEIRGVDPTSCRNPVLNYDKTTEAGKKVGRIPLPSIANFNTTENFGKTIQRGNYYPKFSLNPVGIVPNISDLGLSPQSNWYEISGGDTICPYFGNNSITNTVRRVFHHVTGFVIEFTTQEIGLAIGHSFGINDTVGVSESEIRAAIAGFDNFYGFMFGVMNEAKNIGATRADFGNSALQLYSKILMPLFNIPPQHDINTFFSSLNRGVSQTNNKLNNSLSGSETVPLSPSSSFVTDPQTYNILVKLHSFFEEIGNTYYGKQFMVSVPEVQTWTDSSLFKFDPALPTDCTNSVVIGFTDNNAPIYLNEGSNKVYYSFEPADFAWEEYFNYVDDLLIVGSPDMDNLTSDNNSIYPILGYSANLQYNYMKEFDQKVWDASINWKNNELFNFWKYDAYRNAGIKYNNNNFWEPSISITDSDSVTIKYNKQIYQNGSNSCFPNRVNRISQPETDAFGTTIPADSTYKTYIKAETEKVIQPYFSVALNKIIPKFIIRNTGGAFINPLHAGALSVTTAIVEFLSNNYGGINAVIARKIMSGSSLYATPLQNSNFNVNNANAQNNDNKQYKNLSLSPKAAMPVFAGVPIVLNNAVYGPWVSAPHIIKNDLFADNADRRLENLVGGSVVRVDSDLVPWTYGGMRILDEAALILAAQDNDYQLQLETGSLTIYGSPELSIGNELKSLSYQFKGPTVTNINVQVGENGVQTTYTFRTFTRKMTLFNKESADRLKTISLNAIKSQKELRQQIKKITNQILSIDNRGGISTVSPYDLSGSKLGQYSPLTILVGYSHPYISPLSVGNIGFYPKPGSAPTFSKDSIRQLTTVSIQDVREVPQEFDNMYSTKAFMSLEGLLSPVSFYPTFNRSTNAYKPYFTTNCPICNGTKYYTVDNRTLYCIFCIDKVAGQEPGLPETNIRIPPYILSSKLTDSVIDNPNALSELLSESIGKSINYVNLNPIIMPVGELRNKYAQDSDFTAHHIDVIGRSLVPMAGSLSITDNTNINQDNIFGNLNLADQNGGTNNGVPPSDLDWNAYAFDINNGIGSNIFPQMNHRFLALRGPLVISGWGFDTEGYPVPNSSGEPKEVNSNGFPKLIQSPQDSGGGFESYPGNILGKNQSWDATKGRWSDPYREDTFYKGWGLRPDTWPVGPVDLRWDHKRKVWTAAQNTVFAEVQLEDDLVPTKAARAFLNGADKQAPLPNGLKRMVVVKDESETFGAPRGAKLYCKYDDTTGIYTPLSRQNIITSGIIQTNSNALIYNGYAKGFDETIGEMEKPDLIPVTYTNFLNLPIDLLNSQQPGIFIYINGTWILMSTNCNIGSELL